ncbi:hypothetical protein l11_02880 [Neisseria weaveri LMG 5135]|nr:hypothetical protein l11_02880 [Neisseria weaveri LMG 5135]
MIDSFFRLTVQCRFRQAGFGLWFFMKRYGRGTGYPGGRRYCVLSAV